ncbi:MAG: helix-turn-helix domain-containing protein [Planctomycetaceae bacterium]
MLLTLTHLQNEGVPKMMTPTTKQLLSKNTTPLASLESAYVGLMTFAWPNSSVNVSRQLDECWPQYEFAVAEEKYGRSMGDFEADYERVCFTRGLAMWKHDDDFFRLIYLASEFVDKLGTGNKHLALGKLAGLLQAEHLAQPSNDILFQPVLPPGNPPLCYSEYETLVGGPHVFGARLLWWCAAGPNPNRFGYSINFTLTLRNQPFWFTTNAKRQIVHMPMVLVRIREAAERIMLVSDAGMPSDQQPKIEEEKDGPLSGGRFRWKGNIVDLTKLESRVIDFLWRKRTSPVAREYFISHVWDKVSLADSTVTSCISRLNTKLDANKVGIVINCRNSFIQLEILS